MVNSGNTRRESAQALLIPEMRAAGFDVVADNCDAACVFQQRLPAMDFDLSMYISTAAPDPTVTPTSHCDQIPSEENNLQGQNTDGWCNEEASELMIALRPGARRGDPGRADLPDRPPDGRGRRVAAVLPVPQHRAWRTDQVGGPVDQDAGNYQAFQNIWAWEDTNGDGQIVIGAEQWPECLNPVTECANSSWMVWTSAFKVLPAVWNTTGEGTYVPVGARHR